MLPDAYTTGSPISAIYPNGSCPCSVSFDIVSAARSDGRGRSRETDHTDVNSGFGEGTYKCDLCADTQYELSGCNLPHMREVCFRGSEEIPTRCPALISSKLLFAQLDSNFCVGKNWRSDCPWGTSGLLLGLGSLSLLRLAEL